MDYIGTGDQLVAADYAFAADYLDVTEAQIRAVEEVEAGSYGFDDKLRITMRPEPHIFWRELGEGAKRDLAVRQGIAAQRTGAVAVPRTSDGRYQLLEQWEKIDPAAARRSCSWGIGQIMGFNFRLAGFESVDEMIEAMKQGEAEQLLAMLSFIKSTGLDDELRNEQYTLFAKGYNGPAQQGYDLKIAAAVRKFSGAVPAPSSDPGTPLLYRGVTAVAAVKRAQERLRAHGVYDGEIDGAFGPKTESAVALFQQKHPETGMIDGKVGKKTWAALLTDPAQPGSIAAAAGGAVAPAAGAGTPNLNEPAWVTRGRETIGLAERAGALHNAEIVQLFAETGNAWVKDDETAWCGAWTGAMMIRANRPDVRPPGVAANALRARAWLNAANTIAVPVGQQRPGDIAVFWRGDINGAQGHVGFYISETADSYMILSGNQSNKVSIAAYAKDRLLGFRRPINKDSAVVTTPAVPADPVAMQPPASLPPASSPPVQPAPTSPLPSGSGKLVGGGIAGGAVGKVADWLGASPTAAWILGLVAAAVVVGGIMWFTRRKA